MKTVFFSLLLATLCLGSHSSIARQIAPFTSTTRPGSSPHAKIIHFDGSIKNNKVLLNWTVGGNQHAGMFELQRTTDGTNFTTAAIVFGTDKADTDNYQFYEKVKAKKNSYRLKIIYKDQTVEFSEVINVNGSGK